MIVEIRNVHRRNKGAELMLRAIVAHYAQSPDVTLTGNHRVGSRSDLRTLGMRPLLFGWRKRGFLTTPTAVTPSGILERLSLVHPSSVRLAVDAAGFAYGDQWGPDRAIAAAKYYRFLRAHGARVVLLPQSLGPFERPDVREACRGLFDAVDLIFPRDDTATRCVRELLGDDPRVHQCPDFTPLLETTGGPALPPGDRPAAVIPNRKMFQQGGLTRDRYEAFLVEVIEAFETLGYHPFLLPHATFDHDLARGVERRLGKPVPTLIEPDPVRLKDVIGRCHAVFSSRFHGLVSALSQGVPSIATGWSHKYGHLLDEYGCPQALVDVTVPGALDSAIAETLAGPRHAATRATLIERADWNKAEARKMWARVDQLVTTA
jgi:colanic acid/amylovoran biosynthesis protein